MYGAFMYVLGFLWGRERRQTEAERAFKRFMKRVFKAD
jgi:hypothetical protein